LIQSPANIFANAKMNVVIEPNGGVPKSQANAPRTDGFALDKAIFGPRIVGALAPTHIIAK